MPKVTFMQSNITNQEPSLSKSLAYLFLTVQLIFGFNFGFFKQMTNKSKMAALCFSAATGLLMIMCLAQISYTEVFCLIYFFQYLLTVIILIADNYTLYEFLCDIKAIGDTSQIDRKCEKIGVITWLFTFISFCVKMIIGFLYHLHTNSKLMFNARLVALVPILALDVIPVAIFLIFYHAYAKLRDMKEDYINSKIGLLELKKSYRAVGDLFDKIKATNDKLVSMIYACNHYVALEFTREDRGRIRLKNISLDERYTTKIILGFVTDSPKWMLTIWNHIIIQKDCETWLVLGCSIAFGVHLTMQICLPSICVELVHAQTDAIRQVLQEQLVDETDVDTSAQITALLRYLRGRPLLRKAWRLLPLDLRLPVTMLSMCTTYLIVIIQFSHLID